MDAEERKEHSKKVEAVIGMAANGDQQADAYLRTISYISRMFDDLEDGDAVVDVGELARYCLIDLPTNRFFLNNVEQLSTAHAITLNAWLDSNAWIKSDSHRRNYALVMRDQLTDLCILVAALTGGWSYARSVSLPIRETFLNNEF